MLVLLAEGRRYAVTEVVHVLAEVTGAEDPHGILGKVKPKPDLETIGAEIYENSMLIGDHAYEVQPGWAGLPISTFADHLQSPERTAARSGRTESGAAPSSDEDMLERFAGGML